MDYKKKYLKYKQKYYDILHTGGNISYNKDQSWHKDSYTKEFEPRSSSVIRSLPSKSIITEKEYLNVDRQTQSLFDLSLDSSKNKIYTRRMTVDEIKSLPPRSTISVEEYNILTPTYRNVFQIIQDSINTKYIRKVTPEDITSLPPRFIILEEEYNTLTDTHKALFARKSSSSSEYSKIITPEEMRTLPGDSIITSDEYNTLNRIPSIQNLYTQSLDKQTNIVTYIKIKTDQEKTEEISKLKYDTIITGNVYRQLIGTDVRKLFAPIYCDNNINDCYIKLKTEDDMRNLPAGSEINSNEYDRLSNQVKLLYKRHTNQNGTIITIKYIKRKTKDEFSNLPSGTEITSDEYIYLYQYYRDVSDLFMVTPGPIPKYNKKKTEQEIRDLKVNSEISNIEYDNMADILKKLFRQEGNIYKKNKA